MNFRSPVCNLKSQKWIIIFSHFLHEDSQIDNHKVRKVTNPEFWKKVQSGQAGLISSKNGPKMSFLGFSQKSNPFIYTFLILIWKYQRSSNFLHAWEKAGSWVLVPDHSKCWILETTISHERVEIWGLILIYN